MDDISIILSALLGLAGALIGTYATLRINRSDINEAKRLESVKTLSETLQKLIDQHATLGEIDKSGTPDYKMSVMQVVGLLYSLPHPELYEKASGIHHNFIHDKHNNHTSDLQEAIQIIGEQIAEFRK